MAILSVAPGRHHEAMSSFSRIAFTSGIKALQEQHGSRRAYARRETGPDDRIGPDEAAFIAERDSFYMATVSESGWPYVQHRGGPRGFVRVIDEHTLAFADERGNKQYITAGNLAANDRVALIFVDYPNRARLKVLARASRAELEGMFELRVEGLDWNCSRNITPRYTEEEIAAIVDRSR
jgi:predicted pyridoxine 5'-phosphate oxidase superfamily flavin-nucleotide-binding protein